MKDDKNRVTVASWQTIKKYISSGSKDQEYTPTFGYLVDELRKKYDIYVAVFPITKSALNTSLGEDRIIFGYRSEVYKLSGNNVVIHWTGTGQSFYETMRLAINQAIEFIDD